MRPLDHFLTARRVLFNVAGQRGRLAAAYRQPGPLQRATATVWRDDLVAAAGLPGPIDEPLVHYSSGVSVRIGMPQK